MVKFSKKISFAFWLIFFIHQGFIISAQNKTEILNSPGYPRQVVFRNDSPLQLKQDEHKLDMVVSDHHVWTRHYAHEEYAELHPEWPVLVHVGGPFISANAYSPYQMLQDRELLNGPLSDKYVSWRQGYEEVVSPDFVPMPSFLGYWVYEAGVNALNLIPNWQNVLVEVPDTKRFEPRMIIPPSSKTRLEDLTGSEKVPRIVVICPRKSNDSLDWSRAELADVIETDPAKGTVTLRRFNTGKGFPALSTGTYVAAMSPTSDNVNTWGTQNTPEDHPFHYPVWQHFMPNLTKYCPVDPETGLNAAQWLAKHFVEKKRKYYPNSDGYAMDVSSSTFFPTPNRVPRADFNNDGTVDKGFIDGVSWWGLGVFDFVYFMREGVPGVFTGLGDSLYITCDATDNGEQRFFSQLNGAEYEHTMIHGIGWGPMQHLYSSNLDRLLLWGEKARLPNITFVSNKYPDDAYHGGSDYELAEAQLTRPYTLSYMRLDMASACMVTGYFNKFAVRGNPSILNDYPGKIEQRNIYGVPLVLDYDEFYRGEDNIRHWLGLPVGPALRYRKHLGEAFYVFDAGSALPEIVSHDAQWQASPPERIGETGIGLNIESIGPYTGFDQGFTLVAELDIGDAYLTEMAEYALHFKIKASSGWGDNGEQYRNIPRSVAFRLKASSGRIATPDDPSYYQKQGYYQEVLVFEDERSVDLTLQAPANGTAVLQICLSEAPGGIEIHDLQIRAGCADVLYREFENGLVVLNGSASQSVDFMVTDVLPEKNFRRISGSQDPEHNNGALVSESLQIAPRDAYFLFEDDDLETSIMDSFQDLKVMYSENPGKVLLQIPDNISDSERIKLSVIDILGRKKSVDMEFIDQSIQLNISNLKAGVYLLLVENGNNSFVKKIVKHI